MTKKQHLLKALLLTMLLGICPNLHLHAKTDIDTIFHVDNQFYAINMDDDVRAFNNSFIKVNPDGNADMRITGSATILGLITFPASIQNATSGLPVVINNAGQLGVGTPTFTSDLSVCNGTLFVNEIDPCSPTTTTSFSGSINLPLATTANNGSLQIAGTPFLHNFGIDNTFVGVRAGNLTMSGDSNVAVGDSSLSINDSGASNTAVGSLSLLNNPVGLANTALGANTLTTNDSGNFNTAVGSNSLVSNISGQYNTAVGVASLSNNLTGSTNTTLGALSLSSNQDSSNNTALGASSLSNFRIGTSGSHTAVGNLSLSELVTGSANTAVGVGAGNALIIGNNNIYIGNRGVGIEDSTIRLGNTTTHTGCFVAGISGQATTDIPSTLAVMISSDGKLGTTLSPRRYKDNIRNLHTESNGLTKLRPVAFVYKNDPTKTIQYGLIAEEVAQVYPELVVYDEHGQPQSVMYHELPILLLNEYQEHDQKLSAHDRQLAEYQKTLEAMLARIIKLEASQRAQDIETFCDFLIDNPVLQDTFLKLSEEALEA